MAEIIKGFKMYLSGEKNLSDNTVDGYERDLNQFCEYLGRPIEEATADDVSNFIVSLRFKGMKVSTTNRKLSSLKTFYKYLVRKRIIEFSPAESIEGGKKEQRLPKPVDLEDITELFELIDNLRDRVMFEVLFATGVRREELASIKVNSINFRRGFISVVGKGDKERLIPMYPKALELCERLAKSHKSKWLFPSRKNKGNHISKRQVNEIVTKWVKEAGLKDKDITPHKFRHSFCTYLFDNGADIKTIQDMAGHESASTTNLYTKVSISRNKKEYLQFHPMAK